MTRWCAREAAKPLCKYVNKYWDRGCYRRAVAVVLCSGQRVIALSRQASPIHVVHAAARGLQREGLQRQMKVLRPCARTEFAPSG